MPKTQTMTCHTTICHGNVEKSEKHPKTAVNTVYKEEEKTHVATMNTTHNTLTNNRNDVLLKTVISTVSYKVNTTVTYILLDEGSQKSFITLYRRDSTGIESYTLWNIKTQHCRIWRRYSKCQKSSESCSPT